MTSAWLTCWLTWPRPPLAAAPREPVLAKAAAQRISFSGPQARALWQPRLERLRHAAIAIELEMVRRERIPATLAWTGYDGVDALTERARASGLEAKPIKAALGYAADWPAEASIDEPKRLLDYAFLIGKPPLDASIAEPAADGLEQAAMRFGYPPCCAKSWADHLQRGGSDPLACMLARDGTAAMHAHAALAVLGLGPVRHAPCSADCSATHDHSRQYIDVGRALGFAEEMGWLEAMADWAVDASLVNGVAEITTGAFRCTWLSDESGPPHREPGRGAARPAKPEAATVKPADGAAILAELGTGFEAAGFESPYAMRSRFSTVIWEQTGTLRRAGSAVHVGCGDGLLLELIAQTRPRMKLYGTEEDAAAAEAARRRLDSSLPVLGGTSIEALAALLRLAPDGVDLAFIDPERLAASGREALAVVRAVARTVIVIGTDRSLRRFKDIDTLAATMGRALLPGRVGRVSAALSPTNDCRH